MKVLFTSDLHGNKKAYKRFSSLLSDYDLGIISGDLTCLSGGMDEEREIRNILSDSRTSVLFLMGNMDRYEWQDGANLVFINQRSITVNNQKFCGYQYTTPFSGGMFEKPENAIKKDLGFMEKLIDSDTVFISHGPPYGTLDKNYNGISVGSESIRIFVDNRKPLYHLFGHIHEAAGISGNSINGSYPALGKFVSIDIGNKTVRLVQ